MANIIIVNENYKNEDAAYNTINYVFGSEYYQYSGAVGLLWYPSLRQCQTDKVLGVNEIDSNIKFLADSFQAVKTTYNKLEGQQVVHIVVGFESKDIMNPTLAYIFADQFANYIGQRFQVIYGVHQGSDYSKYYLHVHLIINTISYVDGNRFYDRRGDYYDLGNVAKEIMPNTKWNVYKK